MVYPIRSLGVQAFALITTVSLFGCCPTPLLAYKTDEPPVASLPLEAAGVRDERSVFANRFSAELAKSAAPDNRDTSTWIHWPTVTSPTQAPAMPLQGVSVLVIPGIFGDCVGDQSLPFSDGLTRTSATNLTEGYAYLAPSGLSRVRAVNVRGRESSSRNGERVASAILEEAQNPSVSRIIVVGYSKGVTDTMHAITTLAGNKLPRQHLSFVSLSGVVMGTPIADSHDELYKSLAARFEGLKCTPSDGREVTSLTRQERLRWLAAHPLIPKVNLYTVVAYTDASRISPGLLPFYRLLGQVDPRNDGQMLAQDAVLPNSTLLAEANSDHWTYVLPLRSHPVWAVREASANLSYPRAEFFRALIRTVVELDVLKERYP